MVLAAPEIGDIPEGSEVGNEDGDSEPWPRHTSVHILFSIVLSFSFLFFPFLFHFHALTIEQKERKKKINSRNCDSNFFRANHPPFLPSIFIPFFSSFFSSSRETFVLVPFFITALLFLSYFHWQFAVHRDPSLIYFLRGKILRFLVYFPFLSPPSPLRLPYLLVFINAWPTFPRALTNFSPCCSSPFAFVF